METLILSAGSTSHLHLPISENTSNSMVPVNGKPAIAWILEDIIDKGIVRVSLVMRDDDYKLDRFLSSVFDAKINIQRIIVSKSESIIHSLQQGLNSLNTNTGLRLLLGDTLIQDFDPQIEDVVYVQPVENSHRWCLAILDQNNKIVGYEDKQFFVPSPYFAVCGYYAFSDVQLLRKATNDSVNHGESEISSVLRKYQDKQALYGVFAKKWYDFGNIDNLIYARQELLQSRFFNSLVVDPVLNTITKVSTFDKKLRLELAWFKNLPKELEVICPRIVSSEEVEGKLHLKQEYYGYPTLAELYMFSDLNVDHWESIIERMLLLHKELTKYKGDISKEDARQIYQVKTWNRLKQITQMQSSLWQYWVSENKILNINGTCYHGLPVLREWIEDYIDGLIDTVDGSIIHGDYCFSNILFDLNSHVAKLIDPRGSFGKEGIYGDPRYDIAKFSHSLNGNYDFIVSDQFTIQIKSQEIVFFEIATNSYHDILVSLFDSKISKAGYVSQDIHFIEGLLFLSMIPLHQDKPQRQKAMFLVGIIQLNKVYENCN